MWALWGTFVGVADYRCDKYVFGGCASLIWVGDLFGALNVNDIVVFGVCLVKIFCIVLVICGECY